MEEEKFNKIISDVTKDVVCSELNICESVKKDGYIYCCPNDPTFKKLGQTWKVFLAGPIQGAPSWQHSVREVANTIFLSPRRRSYEGFKYEVQVDWEKKWMNLCDVIIMWVPNEEEKVEGRSYAQTTRTEFGEYLALGKKIIFGCYKGFPGERYFKSKLKEYGVDDTIHRSLDECVDELEKYIKECESNKQVWFTSDTHFGDSRAHVLSRRPFKTVEEMDKVMMRNWNDNVKPCDTIYHLGDFGKDYEKYAPYLNGTKILIYGNYERDNKYDPIDKLFDRTYKNSVIVTIKGKKYCLSHEPIRGKNVKAQHKDVYGCMFGHIHGRSKVKKFTAVDVGVDSWFFKPMNIDDCNFFLNAVKKGYYDQEVWS